jgi:hypothetical protein
MARLPPRERQGAVGQMPRRPRVRSPDGPSRARDGRRRPRTRVTMVIEANLDVVKTIAVRARLAQPTRPRSRGSGLHPLRLLLSVACRTRSTESTTGGCA